MKKWILIAAALLGSLAAQAQVNNRYYVGGNISLGASNYGTSVVFYPEVGKRINDYLMVGLAAGFDWNNIASESDFTMGLIPHVRGYLPVYQRFGLTGDTFGTLYFEEGQQHRRQYTSGLRDLTQICLARGDSLEMVTRTVPFSSAASPFLLLSLLSKGPTSVEIQEGLESVFPFEMDETDLLGIGISDDLLLLNLSTDCEQAIREMDAASQQKLAYALVITLCNALGTQRVRFFFDSGAPETLGTDVFWGGEFLLNHALLEQSRG